MTGAIEYAHPIDEPCPEDCPTRLDEIAAYVSEWAGAYGTQTVTRADVEHALTLPVDDATGINRVIHEVDSTWA